MRRKWGYWVLVVLSGATLILVIVNLVFGQNNRSVQEEVNQRQQFINQTIQLGRVNEALIRAIAQAAIKDKDDRLRDLLAQNGITINPTEKSSGPEPGAVPAPATPASKDK
jgi:hypothetical protein